MPRKKHAPQVPRTGPQPTVAARTGGEAPAESQTPDTPRTEPAYSDGAARQADGATTTKHAVPAAVAQQESRPAGAMAATGVGRRLARPAPRVPAAAGRALSRARAERRWRKRKHYVASVPLPTESQRRNLKQLVATLVPLYRAHIAARYRSHAHRIGDEPLNAAVAQYESDWLLGRLDFIALDTALDHSSPRNEPPLRYQHRPPLRILRSGVWLSGNPRVCQPIPPLRCVILRSALQARLPDRLRGEELRDGQLQVGLRHPHCFDHLLHAVAAVLRDVRGQRSDRACEVFRRALLTGLP